MRVSHLTLRHALTRPLLVASRRLVLTVVAVAVGGATFLMQPPAGVATVGTDDYPHRLKSASQDSLVDPWLFYNRECTSFVAWRLNNDAGVDFYNYYLGEHWGDATNWGNAAQQVGIPVDDNPTRGSVAWWRAGSAGSSRGHVAWVLRASTDSITIEEYNYLVRGGYDQRTISSSSSLWPSGFIHIGSQPLHSTTQPTIDGTAQVGVALRAIRGKWSPSADSFSFQWLANGARIPGATAKFLRPTADLVGANIRVRVTATVTGMKPASALSQRTPKVKLGAFTTTDAPTIVGTPQVGVPLSATTGTWSPTPAYTYQWYAGTQPIVGATDSTYTPTAAVLAVPLTVKVTARRDGYRTTTAASDPSATVIPGTFQNTAPPSISGTAQVGQRLTADPGEWNPSGRVRYQWFADGTPIDGATSRSYDVVANNLSQQLSVDVTVNQNGYSPGTMMSALTGAVAPGVFVVTRQPAVVGTAQVGIPLTADPGAWSPKAKLALQWYADGKPIPGATSATYTPRPAQVASKITLEVTANRAGYTTAVVMSAPSDPVAPGVFENLRRPRITGSRVIGSTLTATPGRWSPKPDQVSYQWRRDGVPIVGATSSTYTLRHVDGGHLLSVRVTVAAAGYTTTHLRTSRVLVFFGDASFVGTPHIRGQAVVGRTLTAVTGRYHPAAADVHYRWFRGADAIRGATDATYVPTTADLHQRITVRITLRARAWHPFSFMTAPTDRITLPGQ